MTKDYNDFLRKTELETNSLLQVLSTTNDLNLQCDQKLFFFKITYWN